MIRKIILDNYMSHVRTEIEPAAGLTVLLGPNNCGKSAVVSALETLAYNTAGDFMIRHGEKEARVTVETDDGHVLVWRRKGSKVSYEIDGREVGRLRRDVPDDLHEHLKLPLIPSPREDEAPFDVHFGQQKQPIFLLNDTESRAAMFFSASSDAGRLLELQDRHREKAREHKTKRRSIASDLERMDIDLAKLTPIDEVEPQIVSLEEEFAALQKIELEIRSLESTLAEMARCDAASRQHENRIAALEALDSLPAMTDPAPLSELVASIEELARKSEVAAALRGAFDELHDPPALADADQIVSLIDSIGITSHATSRARDVQKVIATMCDPPEATDLAPISQAIVGLDTAEKKLVISRQSVTDKTRQLKDVEAQIKSWAKANPNCPICGGPVSVDALLEGAHAHARGR